jgi:hypothetical protein
MSAESLTIGGRRLPSISKPSKVFSFWYQNRVEPFPTAARQRLQEQAQRLLELLLTPSLRSGKTKLMKTSDSKIVADGVTRIRDSEGFRIREEEIKSQLIQSRQGEISSAGWFRRRLILWRIHILASKMAQKELCPSEALYLRTK